MVGKTSDMHKRTFQALKRTFMHVSGRNKTFQVGEDLKCINARNARLCMTQVFPQHILIIKLIYKVFGFIIKTWWGKT